MSFKGLTQRAQKVLTILAQEEAKRFHSDQLYPEHIVLALLKDGEGVAVKTLTAEQANTALLHGYHVNFYSFAALYVIAFLCWFKIDPTRPIEPATAPD